MRAARRPARRAPGRIAASPGARTPVPRATARLAVPAPPDASARTRQPRGARRITSLLLAAEAVFADVGYERATTNAIAKRAGASPGTLYQFFPHKAAMARALAGRYADRFAAVQARAFTPDLAERPIAAVVGGLVDRFAAFHREAPAFRALFLTPTFDSDVDPCEGLRATVLETLTALMAARGARSPADARWLAEISLLVFRGFVPLFADRDSRHRARAIRTLKTVLVGYLAGELASTSAGAADEAHS